MADIEKIFVGKPALDFTAKAVLPDNRIDENFNLKTYLNGKKGVLVFYPLDFTFVCPSEIISFNNKLGWFHDHNTKVISVSVDSHFCHLAWKNTPYSKGGIDNIQFPMVSDLNKTIARGYNVLNDDGIALRGTFLIDENFVLRHMVVNDLQLGRSIEELARTVEALNHVTESGEVCPAGWHKGSESITPSKQGIADYLASNAEKL
jgi:peroxiredoxin 2/4